MGALQPDRGLLAEQRPRCQDARQAAPDAGALPRGSREVRRVDNSILERILTFRPSATAGRNVFTYAGEIAGPLTGDAPSILNRSYTITAEIEIPAGRPEGLSRRNLTRATFAQQNSLTLPSSRSINAARWSSFRRSRLPAALVPPVMSLRR
jgi:hypothetical protein